ncbi:MAG: hypothetical protein WCO93_00675 [bacterium]
MKRINSFSSALKVILPMVVAAPLLIMLAGYLLFSYNSGPDLKTLDSVTLQDGDLVFRRGISIESYAVVMAASGNIYSHIGLIVIEKGIPFVIHVEPGEISGRDKPVQKEPLNSFLGPGKASHFAIYRSHLDPKDLKKVISRAREFYLRKCRFDNAYNLQDDQFLYCTELVLKAYSKGDQQISRLLMNLENINILVYSHKLLMPGAFTQSNFFYRICNQ